MICPYCGLDPVDAGHAESRHGITPTQHTLLQTRRVPDFGSLGAPVGTQVNVTTGAISQVTANPDVELGGYL